MNCMICGVTVPGPPLCLHCGAKDWTVRLSDGMDAAIVNGKEVLALAASDKKAAPAAAVMAVPDITEKMDPLPDGGPRFQVIVTGPSTGVLVSFASNRLIGGRVQDLFQNPKAELVHVIDRLTLEVTLVKHAPIS